MEIKTKFIALDNHQGKEGLSFSPNIVHFNSNKYSSLNNSTVIQKTNVFPTPYTSTPLAMPIQSAVSLNPQLLS